MPFLIFPRVMTLKNKSVDGTEPSQAITLEFGLVFASSENDIGVEKKAQSSMRLGAARRFDLEADARDRHQEILEALGRLRTDKIAIGDDHDSILAVPCHELRTVAQRPVDNLAKPRLGVLKFPGIHFPGVHSIAGSVHASQR